MAKAGQPLPGLPELDLQHPRPVAPWYSKHLRTLEILELILQLVVMQFGLIRQIILNELYLEHGHLI